MKTKIWLKIYSFMFLILFLSSPSHAFYKKKVLIGKFENPVNWNNPYNPGKIVEDLLIKEFTHDKRVHLISLSGTMSGAMDSQPMMGNHARSLERNNVESDTFEFDDILNPEILFIQGDDLKMNKMSEMNKMMSMPDIKNMESTWPTQMGRVAQKASSVLIQGKVVKFLPSSNKENSLRSESILAYKREKAELEVHVELIQNKTGRVLFSKKFRAFSNAGKHKFSANNTILGNEKGKTKISSMDYAMGFLKREIGIFVIDKLDSILLEGEIIATNKNDHKMIIDDGILVNLGLVNGVRIGDLFEVHAMGLRLNDPFSGNDLGDIYVKTGVIKIVHAWEGFSKAVSLGGKNYKKGFLVRGIKTLEPDNRSSRVGKPMRQEEESMPWWEFHGVRTVN
jgi:hypothetical protein